MRYIVVYLDDIPIHAPTREGHDEALFAVLVRLQERSFHRKPSKCTIRVAEVEFLGSAISFGRIEPDVSNGQGILDFPMPSTAQQWQRFHGMCNFCRQRVPRYSDILKPVAVLMGLKDADVKFKKIWGRRPKTRSPKRSEARMSVWCLPSKRQERC